MNMFTYIERREKKTPRFTVINVKEIERKPFLKDKNGRKLNWRY